MNSKNKLLERGASISSVLFSQVGHRVFAAGVKYLLKRWPPVRHCCSAMLQKTHLNKCPNMVSDIRKRYAERAACMISRSFCVIKVELQYLFAFLIQAFAFLIFLGQIIKLHLQFAVLRFKLRALRRKSFNQAAIIRDLLIESNDILLENAQLKNQAIDVGLLRSSDCELRQEILRGSEIDHGLGENVEVRRDRAKDKTPISKTNSQSEGRRPAPT
jgi:hypothetical protein